MCAKSLQLCLTLCDPMDHSPPGSSVHGVLQARILEWVAMPSSMVSSRPRDWTPISHVSWIGRQVLYHWGHMGSPLHAYFSSSTHLPGLLHSEYSFSLYYLSHVESIHVTAVTLVISLSFTYLRWNYSTPHRGAPKSGSWVKDACRSFGPSRSRLFCQRFSSKRSAYLLSLSSKS